MLSLLTAALAAPPALVEALEHAQERHLRPPDAARRLDMTDAALRYAERLIPALVAERTDAQIAVSVGEERRTIAVKNRVGETLYELFEALRVLSPTTDPLALDYALGSGALSILDPHSTMMPPIDAEQSTFNRDQAGIGAQIQVLDDRVTILCPIPGGPAATAGLRPGDRIHQIDGRSTANLDVNRAVTQLRGTLGEPVTIDVDRDGTRTSFTIVRGPLWPPDVEVAMLPGDIALVQIKQFTQGVTGDLLRMMIAQQVVPRGMILDLRGNGGGMLNEAITLADLFIAKGGIVSWVTSREPKGSPPRMRAKARRGQPFEKMPLVVLVDPGSASASEILSGALQRADRAVVMGATTFGKGSVQSLIPLEDGGLLKLTEGEYTVDGVSFQATGVVPDVVLRPSWIADDVVRLYADDLRWRERDADHALPPWNPQDYQSRYTLAWADPELAQWAPARPIGCRTVEDRVDDVEVRVAATLLRAHPTPLASEALEDSADLLREAIDPERGLLDKQLAALTDWSDTGEAAPSGLRLAETEVTVTPGVSVPVRFTLHNDGSRPLSRVRGVLTLEDSVLAPTEVVFGKVPANGTATGTIVLDLPPSSPTGAASATLTLHRGSNLDVAAFPVSVTIPPQDAPTLALRVFVDDRAGGDGDGRVEPGETVSILATVANTGPVPTGDAWMARAWERRNRARVPEQQSAREPACRVEVYESTGRTFDYPEDASAFDCSAWESPLLPGTSRTASITLQIPETVLVERSDQLVPATTESPAKITVLAYDRAYGSMSTIDIAVYPPEITLIPVDEGAIVAAETPLYAATDESGLVLGTLSGPVLVEASGDGWSRVSVQETIGFVRSGQLHKGEAGEQTYAQSHPAEHPAFMLRTEAGTLVGEVSDADGLTEVVVWQGEDKRSVAALIGSPTVWTANVPLAPTPTPQVLVIEATDASGATGVQRLLIDVSSTQGQANPP